MLHVHFALWQHCHLEFSSKKSHLFYIPKKDINEVEIVRRDNANQKELKCTSWPLLAPPLTMQRNRKYRTLLLITSFSILSFPQIRLMLLSFLSISPHMQSLSLSLGNQCKMDNFCCCLVPILDVVWKYISIFPFLLSSTWCSNQLPNYFWSNAWQTN